MNSVQNSWITSAKEDLRPMYRDILHEQYIYTTEVFIIDSKDSCQTNNLGSLIYTGSILNIFY